MRPYELIRRVMMAGGGPPGDSLRDVILGDAPWAYWPLGDSDVPMLDASGNGRHLTEKSGPPTFAQPAIYAGGGGALRLTASSGSSGARVSTANNAYGAAIFAAFSGDLAWTMALVLRPSSLWDGAIPLHIGNLQLGGSQGLWVQLSASGVVHVQAFGGSWTNLLASPAGAVAAGVTCIIHAVRQSAGTASLYVNGVAVATGALGGAYAGQGTSAGGMRISVGSASSGAGGSNFADCQVQDVALYSRALTAAEALQQAQAAGLA